MVVEIIYEIMRTESEEERRIRKERHASIKDNLGIGLLSVGIFTVAAGVLTWSISAALTVLGVGTFGVVGAAFLCWITGILYQAARSTIAESSE